MNIFDSSDFSKIFCFGQHQRLIRQRNLRISRNWTGLKWTMNQQFASSHIKISCYQQKWAWLELNSLKRLKTTNNSYHTKKTLPSEEKDKIYQNSWIAFKKKYIFSSLYLRFTISRERQYWCHSIQSLCTSIPKAVYEKNVIIICCCWIYEFDQLDLAKELVLFVYKKK